MTYNVWFKRLDLDREKALREKREVLKVRKTITLKLLIVSFVLFIIFWYFFLGKLSIYFALVCAMVFLMFSGYFSIMLRDILIESKK